MSLCGSTFCCAAASPAITNHRNLLIVESNLDFDISLHGDIHGFIQNQYKNIATPQTDICLLSTNDLENSLSTYLRLGGSMYENIGIIFHGDYDPTENTCNLFGLKFTTFIDLMDTDPLISKLFNIFSTLRRYHKNSGFHIFSCSVCNSNGFKYVLSQFDKKLNFHQGISISVVKAGLVHDIPDYTLEWNTKRGYLSNYSTTENTRLSAILLYLTDIRFVQDTLGLFSKTVSWTLDDLATYAGEYITDWCNKNYKEDIMQEAILCHLSPSTVANYMINKFDGLVFKNNLQAMSNVVQIPPRKITTIAATTTISEEYINRYNYFKAICPLLISYVYSLDTNTSETLPIKLSKLASMCNDYKPITGCDYPLDSKTNGVGWVAYESFNKSEIIIAFRGSYSLADVAIDFLDIAQAEISKSMTKLASKGSTTTSATATASASATATATATASASATTSVLATGTSKYKSGGAKPWADCFADWQHCELTSPIYVHSGSAAVFQDMKELHQYLGDIIKSTNTKKTIIFAAHSLGTSYASYGVAYLCELILSGKVKAHEMVIELYAYEGNRFACSNFNTYLSNLLLRVNNCGIIPLYSFITLQDSIPLLSVYNTNLDPVAPPKDVDPSDVTNFVPNILNSRQSHFQYQYLGADLTLFDGHNTPTPNEEYLNFYLKITNLSPGQIAPCTSKRYVANISFVGSHLHDGAWVVTTLVPENISILKLILYTPLDEITNVPNSTFFTWIADFVLNAILKTTIYSLLTVLIPSELLIQKTSDAVLNYFISNSKLKKYLDEKVPSFSLVLLTPIINELVSRKDYSYSKFVKYMEYFASQHSIISFISVDIQKLKENPNHNLVYNHSQCL